MLALISHRGPDDSGTWSSPNDDVCLGHQRLSVIDVSPAGHQPMSSQSGRFRIVYNGEIYNYRELRARLQREFPELAWRGTSDTEVLLAAFDAWGVDRTLQDIDGMYAFGLWDAADGSLLLARDRMGEKPLFFGWTPTCFGFGSELKALTCLPDWTAKMHPGAITGYLATGYVRGWQSAVQGIYRLPPGSNLRIQRSEFSSAPSEPLVAERLRRHWSLHAEVVAARSDAFRGSYEEALEAFGGLLAEAVKSRMVSDVPFGAFLSGGVDSTAVVALMQRFTDRPVRTFTIGFDEARFDEAPFARAIARHLGTEHTESYVSSADALAIVPQLPDVFDEPFADQSQIPTLLVSRLARTRVTVALSGDAGDELLGGYGRYAAIGKAWRLLGWAPGNVRKGVGSTLATVARAVQQARTASRPGLSFKLERLGRRIGVQNLEDLRLAYISGSEWRDPGLYPHCQPPTEAGSTLRGLMFADQMDYLPDDILVKLDRASMAASLESRVPFLHPELVRFTWRLPDAFLQDGRGGKRILRDLLAGLVPAALWDRPKQGFAPPVGGWLRGELRDWAESLLTPANIAALPILDSRSVAALWARHQAGAADLSYSLWNVIMLISWQRRFSAHF